MSSRNVFLSAGIACLTASTFGYSVGFFGGVLVLPSFLHHFGLHSLSTTALASARSVLVSLWLLGAFVGVLGATPVCSRFGRKKCLALSAMLYAFGAVLQLLPTGESLWVFECGRLLNGIGVGAGTLVGPIFISEVSSPSQRGVLMSGYQVAMQICALVGFWGTYASHLAFPEISDLQWQIPVAVQFIPGAILFCGSLYIPESPLWLADQEEWDQMRKSLAWYLMEDEPSLSVATKVGSLRDAVSRSKIAQLKTSKSNFLRKVLRKPNRQRLGVGVGLMTLQTVSGTNALNFYAPNIFMSAGFSTVSASLLLTGLYGAVKLVAAASFMMYLVRIRGNRFWLLLGPSVCAASMLVLAYCVKSLSTPDTTSDGPAIYGIIASMVVFIFAFFFGVGIGPISWNVCSEIFPAHLNTEYCAITTCVQWIFQIVNAIATPYMIATLDWVTYLIFSCICALTVFWCAFYVPETRNVPLGQAMDAVFEKWFSQDSVHAEDVQDMTEVDISEETPLLSARRRGSLSVVPI